MARGFSVYNLPGDLTMRMLHYLLGDPRREPEITVAEWCRTTQRMYDNARDGYETSDFAAVSLESACALMYDSRLHAARERFVGQLNQSPSALKVLARLGYGRTHTLEARFLPAQNAFEAAVRDASKIGDRLLFTVAQLFLSINNSDAGLGSDDAQSFLNYPLPDDTPDSLAPLLKAYRIYALSRVYMRRGHRRQGLDLVSETMERNFLARLPSITQGLLYRMHGVLCAICGYDSQARTSLQHAITLFQNVAYPMGEVRTAFSLARVHRPVDRERMATYLSRAQDILAEAVVPPRQMPSERAQLYARRADLEFASGNMENALQLYQQDLGLARDLARGNEGKTRGLAYAVRNVGRTLAAMNNHREAAKYFRESADLFDHVGDNYNVFLSYTSLCESYIASQSGSEVRTLLEHMQRMFESQRDRDKERAIVKILQAQYLRHFQNDTGQALAVLQEARQFLHVHGPDYHYVRALIAEGEIHLANRDPAAACDSLRKARTCAVNLELEDLRRQIENLLTRVGPLPIERPHRHGPLQVSVLFADIRGFTLACQKMESGTMFAFISAFAEIVSRQTSLCGGKPIRFLGDCVMAIFSDPAEHMFPRQCLALEAACHISDRFRDLHHTWAEKQPAFRDIGLGFGISSGDVVAGRFGSEELAEYSVIGEAVNIASRLQGEASDGEIVMSQETAEVVEDYIEGIRITERTVSLKGMPGPVRAYAVQASETSQLIRQAKVEKTGEFMNVPTFV